MTRKKKQDILATLEMYMAMREFVLWAAEHPDLLEAAIKLQDYFGDPPEDFEGIANVT